MTAELVVALCTGIVSIIAAVGAMIAGLRNASAIAETKEEVKADAQVKDTKLEEIHGLVNSRLSRALTEISQLRTFVAELTGKPVDAILAAKATIDAGDKVVGEIQGSAESLVPAVVATASTLPLPVPATKKAGGTPTAEP